MKIFISAISGGLCGVSIIMSIHRSLFWLLGIIPFVIWISICLYALYLIDHDWERYKKSWFDF